MTSTDKALKLLRQLPRINIFRAMPLPQTQPTKYHGFLRKKRGLGHRGFSQFQSWRPLGQLGKKTPFHMAVPMEHYNKDHLSMRPLRRVSLLDLQRLVDLHRVDLQETIDLTSFCNTGLFHLDPLTTREHGFHLTEEGMDDFVAKVHLEVQYASEATIAAVERAGGTIVTRYYDLYSVNVKMNPEAFFNMGLPIPRALHPPLSAVGYYTSAASRGYLADVKAIREERRVLAQKYGYPYIDLSEEELLFQRKHKTQLFYGLEPGWVVNLKDSTVLKPTEDSLKLYYEAP